MKETENHTFTVLYDKKRRCILFINQSGIGGCFLRESGAAVNSLLEMVK